jgi:hypothetical protein
MYLPFWRFPGHTYRYMIQSDSRGSSFVGLWSFCGCMTGPALFYHRREEEPACMHIREARHCVSHCHAGKTTFSTALLRARQASRAPVGVPSATYLLHVPNDNQRRKVTPSQRPAFCDVLCGQQKRCRTTPCYAFALNA